MFPSRKEEDKRLSRRTRRQSLQSRTFSCFSCIHGADGGRLAGRSHPTARARACRDASTKGSWNVSAAVLLKASVVAAGSGHVGRKKNTANAALTQGRWQIRLPDPPGLQIRYGVK